MHFLFRHRRRPLARSFVAFLRGVPWGPLALADATPERLCLRCLPALVVVAVAAVVVKVVAVAAVAVVVAAADLQ